MIRFFGVPWDEISGRAELEPVPVGEDCAGDCGQPIRETDSGVIVPHVTGDIDPTPLDDGGRLTDRVSNLDVTWRPWHRDCFLHYAGPPRAVITLRGVAGDR